MKIADPVIAAILVMRGAFCAYWVFAALRPARSVRRETIRARIPRLALFMLASFFILTPLGPLDVRLLPRWLTIVGSGSSQSGSALPVWARHHLGRLWSGTVTEVKEGHQLICTRPYGLVRHPIYTGQLVAMFGSALALGTVRSSLAVACVAAAYAMRIPREEEFLLGEFGEQYRQYRREVKAIIPFLL